MLDLNSVFLCAEKYIIINEDIIKKYFKIIFYKIICNYF